MCQDKLICKSYFFCYFVPDKILSKTTVFYFCNCLFYFSNRNCLHLRVNVTGGSDSLGEQGKISEGGLNYLGLSHFTIQYLQYRDGLISSPSLWYIITHFLLQTKLYSITHKLKKKVHLVFAFSTHIIITTSQLCALKRSVCVCESTFYVTSEQIFFSNRFGLQYKKNVIMCSTKRNISLVCLL